MFISCCVCWSCFEYQLCGLGIAMKLTIKLNQLLYGFFDHEHTEMQIRALLKQETIRENK